MALNAGAIPVSLVISLNGVQQTVSGMMQVASATRKMGGAAESARKQFANLAGAFTGIMAAGFVKDALVALVRPAMEFETALSRLKALTNATRPQLAAFRAEALRVASITPYGPTQMLNVLLKLQRALGDTAAAKRALEPTTQLAMASFGALTPEKSAEMVSQMVRGFGLGQGDIQTAAERTFAATKLMGLGIEDISTVMGKLATASTLGAQSFDEVIKMFVLARREMPSSERAATLLMTAYSEMAKPKVREGLGRLGIEMQDAMGHPRKMGEVMLELADRYQGSSREVRNAINNSFGMQAQKPILAILNQLSMGIRTQTGELLQGRAAYDYLSKGMVNSQGILKDLSDEYKKTAAARWQEMTESLTNLGIVIGKTLLPRLKSLADRLASVFRTVRNFFESPAGKAIAGLLVPIASWAGLIWAGAAALQGFSKIARVVTTNLKSIWTWLRNIAVANTAVAATGAGSAAASAAGAGSTAATAAGAGAAATGLRGILTRIATRFWPVALIAGAAYGAHAIYKGSQSAKETLGMRTANEMATGTYNQANNQFLRRRYNLSASNEEYVNNLMPWVSKKYQELMEQQKKLLNEKKAVDELAIKSGREWYSYIQQGTKQWMEAIGAFRGIIEYKPPKLEAGTLYALQSQFAQVEKRTKGKTGSVDDYNAAVSARATALEINRLLGIAVTNPKGLSPRQTQTLQNAAAKLTVWGEKLGLKGTEAFRKRFAMQAIQLGTPANIDYMTAWLQGSAGRLPGAGREALPGWNAGVGGYAAPGTAEPYDMGFLKNAWGLPGKPGAQSFAIDELFKPAFSKAPEPFIEQTKKYQQQAKEQRIKEVQAQMNNIVRTLSSLLGTVQGNAIRVRLEQKDPQGGSGSGNDNPARPF